MKKKSFEQIAWVLTWGGVLVLVIFLSSETFSRNGSVLLFGILGALSKKDLSIALRIFFSSAILNVSLFQSCGGTHTEFGHGASCVYAQALLVTEKEADAIS